MNRHLKEKIREAIQNDQEITRNLHSLTLFGSNVRGDYIPGLSDLDFLAVLHTEDPEAVTKLQQLLKESTLSLEPKLIDLPHILLEHLSDPLHNGHPFKFLTFYQRDFRLHHETIYGQDPTPLLPLLEPEELATWRAETMLMNLERLKDRPELLKVQAGEVAKFIAVQGGARSISKTDVLCALKGLDCEAYGIYRDYVDGAEPRPDDFYRLFIIDRLDSYLENIGGRR